MSFKTTFALIITIVLTIVIMQNTDAAKFTLFYMNVTLPKLTVLTGMSVGGFLLGVLVSTPRRAIRDEYEDGYDDDGPTYKGRSTLSDEDRDYIS